MIKEYKTILDLPEENQKLLCDNMFFSEDYARCVAVEGRTLIILASTKYVIPFTLSKKAIFRYGTFAYQPVCICADGQQTIREFLDEVIAYLSKKRHVHFLTPNPAYTIFEDYPTKSRRIPFGNHVCDLSLSEEELFGKLHSKHRNCVRKAHKDGVTIKSGRDADLLSDYIRMDTETWARSNRAASGLNFYASKIEALPRNTKVFIAYKDGVPQSGAFIYYDQLCGYYMFGANTNSPYAGSGNLLQWEIMLWLKQQGVKKYSFVGCRINEDESSKYHSIQRFKERFGGDLIQGYMFKCVCNKMMFKIFRLIMHLRGSSGVDAIDQEICKWRELN